MTGKPEAAAYGAWAEHECNGHRIDIRATRQRNGKWAISHVYIAAGRPLAGARLKKLLVPGRWDTPDEALRAGREAAERAATTGSCAPGGGWPHPAPSGGGIE
ncbi:MAG: hypothetical protein ACE5Q3_20320 [Alphaproteobacteria bacterium]